MPFKLCLPTNFVLKPLKFPEKRIPNRDTLRMSHLRSIERKKNRGEKNFLGVKSTKSSVVKYYSRELKFCSRRGAACIGCTKYSSSLKSADI